MTNALSDAEWLQAARALLGAAPAEDLRLVDVRPAGHPQGLVDESLPVTVRVARSDGSDPRSADLLLKVVPKNDATKEALLEDSCAFHKESGLFALLARLAPRLRTGTLPHWSARCLLARPRLMVFEDLAAQGFHSLDARKTLDFEHCAAALDALARLHAASLALEEADRRARRLNPWRLGERFPDALQEVLFSEERPSHVSRGFLSSLDAIKTVTGLMHEFCDSPRYADILQRLDDVPRAASDMAKPSDKHRNVICHGDPRVTNIVFRYSSSGQVLEARLLNLQLSRYAPPALDVSALLHLATRRDLREARGPELRDLYHSSLTRTLAQAGFPAAEGLLTRSAFDASWKPCAPFGAAVAARLPGDLLPADVLLALLDSSQDLERYLTEERCSLVAAEFDRDADYRERVGEIASDLVRLVALSK